MRLFKLLHVLLAGLLSAVLVIGPARAADTVAGNLKANLEVYEQDDESTRGGSIRHVLDLSIAMANGTSDGQIGLIYSKRDSVAASGTDSHDLAGTLVDAVGGDTITFVEVVAIVLVNRSTTSGDDLALHPHATNGFTGFTSGTSPTIRCPAGITGKPGFIILHAPRGRTVTAGSTDILAVTELGGVNTVSYDIYVLGRAA